MQKRAGYKMANARRLTGRRAFEVGADQSAVAVRDTVSGVITVLSPDCAELVSVQPLP
jgi:hypothetical protein